MGIKTIYTCDICGQIKGESNHWYMAKGGELTSDLKNFSMLQIIPFTKQFAANWSILCGESCIHKFVSQNLNLLHTEREASSISTPALTSRTIDKFLGMDLPSYEKYQYKEGKE